MIGSGFYDYKVRTGLYSTAIVFYRNKVDETWVFEAFFDQAFSRWKELFISLIMN